MSCNYADGLSPYDNKGVLGLAEHFDSAEVVEAKCKELAQLIKESKYTVIHSGAGISTSAGIPDFRGPKGVWTLEEKGLKPDINVSFGEAKPTKTHMAIKKFIDEGLVHFIVSQNIDGLHLKSGISREYLAELHGNMFIEQCNFCKRQFVRSSPSPTVGQRSSGELCKSEGRPCRGKLQDTILDWEHSLPDDDLELSDMHSSLADLSICLGTTLQIVPSGNIPLNTLRCGGKLVICNLQPTKHDNKADLIINTYVDDVMEKIFKILGIAIPSYSKEKDPTYQTPSILEWTVNKSSVSKIKTIYRKKCFGVPKKRKLTKAPNNFKYREKASDIDKPQKIKRTKLEKTKSKIPKPKKTQKSKIVDESDDDIIVIGDEDSDDSDVICLEDDTNEQKESIEKESNIKNNKNDLVTPKNIVENIIKSNIDIPKVNIKNIKDIPKDEIKNNENIPKDVIKSNQDISEDDMKNNTDILKDEIIKNENIPKDDIKNNKDIQKDDIKSNINIPENIKSNKDIPKNELKNNENTSLDIVNNKDDIKNNQDIPEDDIKSNVDIPNKDIKKDVDVENRSDYSINQKINKDYTEDRIENVDNKRICEDKTLQVEGIIHKEHNLSEIE